MKVTDIRVGNSIKIDGVIATVDAHTIFDFDNDKRVKEGIDLNVEIIRNRFLFDKNIDGYYFKEVSPGKGLVLNKANDYYYPSIFQEDEMQENIISLDCIKHVHELQNIWRYNFNEELEYLHSSINKSKFQQILETKANERSRNETK